MLYNSAIRRHLGDLVVGLWGISPSVIFCFTVSLPVCRR